MSRFKRWNNHTVKEVDVQIIVDVASKHVVLQYVWERACSHFIRWNDVIWNDYGSDWNHLEASFGCGLIDSGRSAAESMWEPHQV